jgi:hypothetical protein
LKPSTVTKAATSKAFLVKGKFYDMVYNGDVANFSRFGWVNASYIYGLTLLSAHQRRALGALTDYDSYEKAINDLGMA